MKAEERIITALECLGKIEIISGCVNGIDFKKSNFALNELLKQAVLGRAVEKAFEEGYMIGKDVEYWFGDGECCKSEIETIASNESDLLEWYEKEGKK